MSVVEGLASDLHSLKQQAHGTVAAAAAWAEEVHLTLHGIRHNTSQLFYWTAFLGALGATTALFYALHQLRDQLEQLNRHQVAYRDMWARERDRQQTRARDETGAREATLNCMTADWDEVEQAKFDLLRKIVARTGQSEALLEELVVRPPHRSGSLADHDALRDHLAAERGSLPPSPGPNTARATASGYLGGMGLESVDRGTGHLVGSPGMWAAASARSSSHSVESEDSHEQTLIEEMDM